MFRDSTEPQDMDRAFRPLSTREKVALATEVLGDYWPMWRNLKQDDVVEMVGLARNVRPSTPSPGGPEAHRTALRLGRAVARTLRLLPTDSRCLIQSLVLTRMLARRSMASVLVIGVRTGSAFEAHAWVEHEGRPILPPGQFTRLVEL